MIKKEIQLGGNKYLVIDLTQPLRLDVEVYPGIQSRKGDYSAIFAKTGVAALYSSISDHNFQPHGDAPNHQNSDMQDKGFEFWDLNYCFNSAILIDLPGIV